MALYELRTYRLRVGAMAEAVKLYQEVGFPAPKGYARLDPAWMTTPVTYLYLDRLRLWSHRDYAEH